MSPNKPFDDGLEMLRLYFPELDARLSELDRPMVATEEVLDLE